MNPFSHMEKPLEVAYRDVTPSPELDHAIRGHVDRLEKVCDHIISCSVAVEDRQKSQASGSEYRVRVDVRVPPRHELVATHDEGKGDNGETVMQAIGDAFRAMERQLKRLNDKQNDKVKSHVQDTVAGIVTKIFEAEGYGFLQSIDGREIYFHRNSVLNNGFERLELGAGVMFNEEQGEDGPQATTIHIVDKVGRDSPTSG